MAEELRFADITTTQLDGGSVQYDIEPLDGSEHVTVIVAENGKVQIRDEDGVYSFIEGEPQINPTIDMYAIGVNVPLNKHSGLDGKPTEGQQVFFDPKTDTRIEVGLDEDTKNLMVVVQTVEHASSSGGEVSASRALVVDPKSNIGLEEFSIRTREPFGEGGTHMMDRSGDGLMTPNGVPPVMGPGTKL